MWAVVICHGKAEWMPPHGMDEFTVQRAAFGFTQVPSGLAECANRVAELVCRCVRCQWCTEGHGDRVGNPFRPFPEEATALEAEDAAPKAIQVRGKARPLPSLHNPFKAATEWQQGAGAGDLPFREDADKFSVVECLP